MISDNFTVEKIKNGVLVSFFDDYVEIDNWIIQKFKNENSIYLSHKKKPNLVTFDDSLYIIKYYLSELYSRSFSTILLGGLGIGLLPYMCQTFCDKVDVIEIDKQLINLIKSKNYLNEKVNIYNSNIFTYITDEKYDVICIDIWDYDTLETLQSEISTLKSKFSKNLTENGVIIFPIINKSLIKN